MTTPLAAAIRQVLRVSGLAVFDYRQAFFNLWSEGLKADHLGAAGQRVIAIFGTQPPAGAFSALIPQAANIQVDFSDHFTAYSWAAVFRLLNPNSSVKIVIIDCLNDSIQQGPAADLQNLFARNVTAASTFVPGAICIETPSLSQIIAALSSASPPPMRIGQQAMLRGIIQQHLLPNPEDHHKLGNIVGALMLSPERNSGSKILGRLFQALQPETEFDSATNLPAINEQLRKRVATASPFILFDDMGSLWAPFIRQWVPKERLHIPEVTEACRSNLVERLKVLAAEPVQRRRLNASDFGVATIAHGEAFVLLLDLRLFAGVQTDDEAKFIGTLKESAAEVSNAKHLKWPQLPKDEMREVEEAWYLKAPYSPNYRKARSWLARMISLIDPTLPIVIFSSTQDPEVLRQFQGHGNIVTDFSKPMFRGVLGETREWAGAATLTFEKAMHSALRISSAQKRVWDILVAANRVEEDEMAKKERARSEGAETSKTPQPGASPLDQVQVHPDNRTTRGQGGSATPAEEGTKPARVEIFVDESGHASETRFAIGAVVLISGTSAFDHATYRTSALNDKTLGLWGLDDVVNYRKMRDLPIIKWLEKGKDLRIGAHGNPSHNHNQKLDQTLGKIEKLVTDQGGRLFACSLLSQEQPVPHDTTSLRHPYHRYRDMLSRLLEAILFHFEPVVKAIQAGAEICVDAAMAKNDADDWNLNSLWEDFGAERFTDYDKDDKSRGDKCRTLGGSHVLPLVTGLLVRYRRDREGVNRRDKDPAARVVRRARGPQLTNRSECGHNTLSRQDRVDPKPLHHLADWIAHITWDTRDWSQVPRIAALKAWFESGFRQTDDHEFRSQLRSLRQWAQGVRIDAIVGWKKVDVAEDFALTPRMAKGAAKWMEDITADDLTALFHSENLT
jgi:hypothetical protein